MPVSPTYPGVYVQEISSGVRTVSGVPTSVAAFVGRAKRGPVNQPTTCFNFGEFTRRFGGLWLDGPLSYAVDDFFANGGGQAEIVRVFRELGTAGVAAATVGGLDLVAANPGDWGNRLTATTSDPAVLDPIGAQAAADKYGLLVGDLFDLRIEDSGSGITEIFRSLTIRTDGRQQRVDRVLAAQSNLARATFDPNGDPVLPANTPLADSVPFAGGDDGDALDDATIEGVSTDKTGIYALKKADIFNLLCIPPDTREGTVSPGVYEAAAAFCKEERALLIVDPPAAWDANPDQAAANAKADHLANPIVSTNGDYAAIYFPRLRKADPELGGQIQTFPPCGAVAGVIARTDTNRGVWKAAAGLQATLANTTGLTVKLTDEENGLLNPIAINCLRSFPNIGRVVWGARTLDGSDIKSHDYKYIPVRRLALFIEESLYRGTQWVVFEPNDEPLWAQVRLSVGGFMQRLFRQGAFQGTAPRDAYFVKCDSETTTQDDINRGIVNIVVGFAPLKPAEFVVISIVQIGQAPEA